MNLEHFVLRMQMTSSKRSSRRFRPKRMFSMKISQIMDKAFHPSIRHYPSSYLVNWFEKENWYWFSNVINISFEHLEYCFWSTRLPFEVIFVIRFQYLRTLLALFSPPNRYIHARLHRLRQKNFISTSKMKKELPRIDFKWSAKRKKSNISRWINYQLL